MAKEFEIRIAILDMEGYLLSSDWHIWSGGEEIYAASGGIEKTFKTSLHSSGKYRHAFVSQKHSDLYRLPGLDRAVYKWDRPMAQSPMERLLFQILFPGVGLSGALFKSQSTSVISLSVPNVDEVLYLSIVELAPNSHGEKIQFGDYETSTLAEWKTPAGMRLRLVSHLESVAPADLENWRETILNNPQIEKSLQMAGPNDDKSHLRASVLMNATDRVGRIMDFDIRAMRSWALG